MKRSITSALLITPLLVLAQPGTLDPTFNGDGLLLSDLLSFDDEVHALAVQPDGKILGAGWTEDGSVVITFIERFLENGAVDPSFGIGGKVYSAAAQESRYAYAVGVQSTGRIIVAGLVYDINLDGNAMLLGFLPDGSPDPDFGTAGVVSTSYNALFGFQSAWAMHILPDDRIVVVGEEGENGLACARFTANGALDPGFGTSGIALSGVPFSSGLCLDLFADGSVIAGGYRVEGDSDWLLVRFDNTGTLDPNFGVGGTTTMDIGGGDTEFMRGLSVLADGRIAVCGHRSFNGADDEPAVGLFEANGDPAIDFGTNGLLVLPYTSPQWGQARSIIAQSDGKLLVAGFRAQPGAPSNNDFFLMRLLTNGSLDPLFAGNGLVHTDVSGSYDRAFAMALAPNGSIVVAGYGTGTQRVAAYARYINDIGSGITQTVANNFTVFPQPAIDHINISFTDGTTGPYTISLYGGDGSLVSFVRIMAVGSQPAQFDLPVGLSPGVYAVEVREPDQFLRARVMVVRP